MSSGISSRRSRSGGRLMRDDVEAEEQILAELPVGDRLLEIAVGRGDDADVDVDVVLAAEARELAVLQHLQQLGLQRRAHVADLVEEHRAVVGELELARLVLDRAGEGAALEAEQLRFEQLGRQRGAVHLDERLVAPERGGAERPRDKLLAGAAFAANEDRDVGVGDALDQVAAPRPSARCGRTASCMSTATAAARAATATSRLSWRCFSALVERHFEIGLVERLADEVGGAELHRLHDGRRSGPGPTAR